MGRPSGLTLGEVKAVIHDLEVRARDDKKVINMKRNLSLACSVSILPDNRDGVWAFGDVYFFLQRRNRTGLITQSCE